MTYQKFKDEAKKLNGITLFLIQKFVAQSLLLLLTCIFGGVSVVYYCFNKSLIAVVIIVVLAVSLYSSVLDYMVLESNNFIKVYNIVHKFYPFVSLASITLGVVFMII